MSESEQRTQANTHDTDQEDLEAVRRLKAAHEVMRKEIARAIVGQSAVLDELLIALFCRGRRFSATC